MANRAIKFRAWDKKRKEMFAVHELHINRISGEIKWVRGYGDTDKDGTDVYGGGIMQYANKPRYELMQFTGLLDKNGVEIYEGDILHALWPDGTLREHTIVRWKENGQWSLSAERIKNRGHIVVGNIHANPELVTP